MSFVRVTHTIGDLASDLRTIAVEASPTMAKVVRKNAIAGNRIAREFASQQHTMNSNYDIHYPRAFSAEARSPLSWEYGPDASKPQGGMSFERGSRNQPPHLDLARSADIIAPRLASEVLDAVADLFWPGA
jgi:hypothetical protein